MSNPEPKEGRCNAQTRDGNYCMNYPVEGSERCRMHGGTDNGAPENNGNAVKHNLNADDDKLYARLSDTRKEVVDSIIDSLIDRYKEYHGREPDRDEKEDFFEIGMQAIHRRFVRDYMAEQAEESGNPMLEHVEMEKNGETIEFDKPIELLDQITDSMRETRLMKKHTGLFKDPDTKQAEAMEKTLAEVLRES